MLGHSSTEAFQVEVEGEMLAKFQEQAEQRLRLKNTGKRICDLILGSPDGQVWLAGHLKEAVRWLQAMQVERQEAVVGLEGLRSSAAQV
jgi:hypothetical protein